MKIKGIIILSVFAMFMGLTGCDEDIIKEKDQAGTVIVNLTDGPFSIDLVEWAKVTFSGVEIRKAGVSDTVPFIKLSDEAMTYDLMKLRNGIKEQLVEAELPAGSYDQVRLITSEASLKIKNGGVFNVKIPSGSQTGIKVIIKPALVVEGGITTDLLIDFDLSKSFVMRGNLNKPDGINGFNFKPVIRAVNETRSGTITGIVTDNALKKIINASVWVAKDSVIATSFTDTLGRYVLPGIPAGIYQVGAAREKYDSLVFSGVSVTAGNKTIRNFALKPQ